MKSNLAYIDDALDQAVAAEKRAPNISDAARKKASADAMKVVAGFHLKDEAAEKAALDKAIEERRKKLIQFTDDRKAVRTKLGELGVTPLAVVPTVAWVAICKRAGLYLLWTDDKGLVSVSRDAFDGFAKEKEFVSTAAKNWPAIVARLFPDQTVATGRTAQATLVMPQPPADV